jgi:hypothetical protein
MLKRFAGGNGEGLKGKRFDQPVCIIAGTTVTAIGEDGHVKLLDHSFHQSGLTVANAGLTLDEALMLNANRAPVSRLPAEVRVKG